MGHIIFVHFFLGTLKPVSWHFHPFRDCDYREVTFTAMAITIKTRIPAGYFFSIFDTNLWGIVDTCFTHIYDKHQRCTISSDLKLTKKKRKISREEENDRRKQKTKQKIGMTPVNTHTHTNTLYQFY